MAAESRFEVPHWKINLVKSYFDGKDMKHDLSKEEDLEDTALDQADFSELNTLNEIPCEVSKAETKDEDEALPPETNSKHYEDVCESNVDDESYSSQVEDCQLSPDTTLSILHDQESALNYSSYPEANLSDEVLICSPSTSRQNELMATTSPSSTTSALPSARPKLVKNKCQFPIKTVKVLDERDQGRNCVIVVIKSRNNDSTLVRQRTVSKRSRKVENLVSKFELKYEAKYSSEIRAVYNFCFVSPLKARKFFADVNDVIKNDLDGPNSASIFMCDEEMLGFQHEPVLTEQDLLLVHSPEMCTNVFRTSVRGTVGEDSEGNILLIFRSVVDVNTFLFEKCSNNKAKTFGELKTRKNNLVLKSDEDGLYKLVSKDLPSRLRPLSEKYDFSIKNDLYLRTLSFHSKVKMFKFLLSDDLHDIENLQILPTQIVNLEELTAKGKIMSNDDVQENKNSSEEERGRILESFGEESEPEIFESKDSVLDDSCATDASLLEIALAQKDEEIRYLKGEIYQKDEIIERQRIQSNRIESRYFEASNNLEKIRNLVTKLENRGHILSTIDQIRLAKDYE